MLALNHVLNEFFPKNIRKHRVFAMLKRGNQKRDVEGAIFCEYGSSTQGGI